MAPGGAGDGGVADIASITLVSKERAVNIRKRPNQETSAADQAKLKQIEALDFVTLEFNGKGVTVGKERDRFCSPMFDPMALSRVSGLEATFSGCGEEEKGRDPVLSVSEAAWRVFSGVEVDQPR